MSQTRQTDPSSLPPVFQAAWKSNADPTALPFPRDNPPFALTPTDWHQLSLSDSDFTPHSWTELQQIVAENRLEELKRWPSALKAYLAWTAHVKGKKEWGGGVGYVLRERLFWDEDDDDGGAGVGEGGGKEGRLTFKVRNEMPLAHPEDYSILRNDWPYAFEPGIEHLVVWCKHRLPVEPVTGALSEEGKRVVEDFVKRVFRERVGEEREGEKVVWFKNTVDLQSVRGLEHVHVIVRDVEEEVLGGWMV